MKFTDLGDTGAQLNIKVEAAPAGVKLAAGAAMGALSGAGGHILGAVFGPIGSIAMAAAMAHQGATLGMKMADGIWDFFSDKLGGDDNAEEFAMAHLTASAKGLPTFDYRGKTYNVKVPQQQARAAAVEVRKVTESLTERRQQGLVEFAPAGSGDSGDDGFDERMLKQLAAQWWNGDEDPKAEKTLLAAGWEIGQDEGYDNGGVFVVQAGDEHGKSYISWPAEELQQGVAEDQGQNQQWSNKDMEKLRVATRDFDDILSANGPDAFKQELIKKRIKTKPMPGPKGQLPEQGVVEGSNDGRDKFYYQRNNIWRVMDGDDLVQEYTPDRYEVVGAKKLLARFDDEGYDVDRVISPMGTITYLYGKPEEDIDEGVAETLPLNDALKLLRQYGAENLKTTSNELHFYKNGRAFSVDLVMNPDATRSASLSSLNAATRGLKGQGVSEDDIEEASLASMRDFFNQPDDSIAVNRGPAVAGRNPAGIPNEIQTLVNKMYHAGKISPKELEILRDFQRKTKINVGIREADKNPYAIGMSQAMKSTGDKPPLKKSTINKAHEIARAVKKGE